MSCLSTRARPCLLLLLAAALLAGCDWLADLPKDPEKTLERVRGGSLRAGAIHAPPWVVVGPGEPSGSEADIVRQLARELDAEVEWRYGAPDQMLKLLEVHELDLVLGGFEDKSPALRKVGTTRPYATILGTSKHVLAVPPGENAWTVAIDRSLDRMQARQAGHP